MKKRFYYLTALFLIFVLQIQAQNGTCQTIAPFCAGGSTLTFESPVGTGQAAADLLPYTYGCLGTEPNPAWFFMQIEESGNLDFQLSQISNNTGNGIDVDFVAWGPFPPLTDPEAPFPYCGPNFLNAQTEFDCSFSGLAIENVNIVGAVAGEIYVVLITNFSGQPGQISLNQTGGNGTTSCDIVCPLSLGPNLVLCPDQLGFTTITASIENAASYEWFFGTNPLPFNTQTIPVTEYGTYSVIVNKEGCVEDGDASVEIIEAIPPTFNPITELVSFSPIFDLTEATQIISGGDPNYEVFYFASEEDLINQFPEIPDPSNHNIADGDVIYALILLVGESCPASTSFNLVNQSLIAPNDISLCDDTLNDGFAFFDLTSTNFLTVNNISLADFNVTFHTSLQNAQNDTAPIVNPSNYNGQTSEIFIRAENVNDPTSFGTTSFNLEVIELPVVPNLPNVSACDSYTLPALAVGNYRTAANGGGVVLNAGTQITSTQTIFIYAATNTTPNCFTESSFTVTINQTPNVPELPDVAFCDGENNGTFILPALNVGSYFTAPNGGGVQLNAGDLITSTQTIYIYAETGTTPNCTDQSSFEVTISSVP
ncbi:MAG: hypothetical protein ACOVLC_12455, partial [Flavobacterium sp.]